MWRIDPLMLRIEMLRADRFWQIVLGSLAGMVAILLCLVLAFLVINAWPALANQGWQRFFLDSSWYPLENQFGLLPMLAASLMAALGAVMLATPLALASAIFINFYASTKVAKRYRQLLGLLAGIPSVVFGLWGLTELVPLIAHWQPPGASLCAAIIILALMILPTCALLSTAAIASLPAHLYSSALALGLSKNTSIVCILLPAARAGIYRSILLSMARALGETMAVLMVAGNVVQWPTHVFNSVRVLPANIALEMAYAGGVHRAGLFASGLLLMLLVLLLSSWAAYHDAKLPT